LSGDHVPELQDEDKQWQTYSFDQIRGRLTGDGAGAARTARSGRSNEHHRLGVGYTHGRRGVG
jgi:hypothetical protein